MNKNKKGKFLELISFTRLGRLISSIAVYYHTRILSEKIFIKRMFKARMGYNLDLKNPKTLNEKIQWLKLYDRTKLHTICADKLLVRDYIKEQIGEDYLVPLLFSTFTPNNIKYKDLPIVPFIVKANHNSGSYHIFQNREDVKLKELILECEKWLKTNYYYFSKEWQYKFIKPCILFEKLLIEKDLKNPRVINDYKVHCFNSFPTTISVDFGRGSNSHIRNWYNTNWEQEPFEWSSLLDGKVTGPDYLKSVAKPIQFDKMLELSKKLAKPFKYVRIDWYEVNGILFFGEITFHHDSGFRPILPIEFDYKFGDLIKL